MVSNSLGASIIFPLIGFVIPQAGELQTVLFMTRSNNLLLSTVDNFTLSRRLYHFFDRTSFKASIFKQRSA
ncbi:hypothetical protein J2772_002266 [Chryseobacterium jejuense]|nr:hypothetical protein [Chryseobacterium jejuense]